MTPEPPAETLAQVVSASGESPVARAEIEVIARLARLGLV